MSSGEKVPPRMRGRLRQHLPFWKSFCQSTLVLAWISSGFPLKWNENGPPTSKAFRNHPTAFENAAFVTKSITELVDSYCLLKVSERPFLVLPLGVVFKASNNKPRLIFDARYLNFHLVCPNFKYEDLGTIHQFLKPNDFMITTDFSKGYHHMDIDQEFWKYFGIEWDGVYYVYTTMPFGLSVACWAFTKLTRELRNKWRRMGRRCGTYLDDGLHAEGDQTNLKNFVNLHLLPDTHNAGFILNMGKSKLEPSQHQEYLGMVINTVQRHFSTSSTRRDKIISLINSVLTNRKHCSIHSIEVVAGNLISVHWAFGRLARLMTMSLYQDINKRSALSKEFVCLSMASIHDLEWWLKCFNQYNGFRPMWQPPGFHMTFYTDAAGRNLQNFGGWAGWTKDMNGRVLIAKGVWSHDLSLEHSTLQELLAIFHVIRSFNNNKELDGKRIRIKTDNEGVTFIINKGGSRDKETHSICKDLLWYCIDHHIHLTATWIPRDLNEFADYFSKHTDSGDYKLDPAVFQYFEKTWGPFHVDLFASFNNYQFKPFYSLYCCPEVGGIDAFTFHWSTKSYSWCNPPFNIVGRAWEHGHTCQAKLCFLIPFTPTASWWHLISPSGSHFSPYILSYKILQPRKGLFLAGRVGHSFKDHMPHWRTLVLLVDFSRAKPNRKIVLPL